MWSALVHSHTRESPLLVSGKRDLWRTRSDNHLVTDQRIRFYSIIRKATDRFSQWVETKLFSAAKQTGSRSVRSALFWSRKSNLHEQATRKMTHACRVRRSYKIVQTQVSSMETGTHPGKIERTIWNEHLAYLLLSRNYIIAPFQVLFVLVSISNKV